MWDRFDLEDFMDASLEYFFLGLVVSVILGVVFAFILFVVFNFSEAMEGVMVVCALVVLYFVVAGIGYVTTKVLGWQ